MIYVTLLNPSVDIVYPMAEIVLGNTYTSVKSHVFPAGKGMNFAKTVRSLGERVKIIGTIPENSRSIFEEFCRSRDIEYSFVTTPGNVRINTTLLEKEREMVTHINSVGEAVDSVAKEKTLRRITGSMAESDNDFWAFTGSMLPGFCDTTYADLIEQAEEGNLSTALDTSGIPLRYGMQKKPCIVSPNISELEKTLAEKIEGIRHITLKGKRLIDEGIEFVFITLGKDGVIALNRKNCFLCTPPEIQAIDSVGSGDAFLAGAVVSKIRGDDFETMCRRAVACGVSNAQLLGPGNIDTEEIDRIFSQISVESI
jgi:1-phosphofructokinase family hexose kinase